MGGTCFHVQQCHALYWTMPIIHNCTSWESFSGQGGMSSCKGVGHLAGCQLENERGAMMKRVQVCGTRIHVPSTCAAGDRQEQVTLGSATLPLPPPPSPSPLSSSPSPLSPSPPLLYVGADCVEGIDSQTVDGYVIFKGQQEAKLQYPALEEGPEMGKLVAGRGFHNGRFVQAMRRKAASLPG